MAETTRIVSSRSTNPPIEPALIPFPAHLETTGTIQELKSDAVISYVDDSAKKTAEMLADWLRPATGFALPVKPNAEGAIIFQIREDAATDREGYELCTAPSVRISAPDTAGLFYGAQTFRQLLPPEIFSTEKVSKVWKFPSVILRDFPRFGWRGLMLDASRYFIPKKDVFRIIDTMASLKFNILHWHLTDDQGWRIEIKKFPKLTDIGGWRDETLIGHTVDTPIRQDGKRHGGFYTQPDIREIIAYAAARQITIVPEIDMPGHMQAAIAAYPKLGCTSDSVTVKTDWGISPIILNPEESTVRFCKDVLSEVMELFPSKFIHIGGDEAKKDQWENSEYIQQLRKKRGLKNMHEMQSWFIRQIDDFLTSNGRRLIGWDEISEGGLAKNATVMWWRGEKQMEIARKAAQNGHDIVVATKDALYFDYYQSEDKKKEPLAIGGFLPLETVYAFDPVFKELDASAVSHILGAQGQLWGEYMPDLPHIEYMAYPRACALAEIVWSSEKQKSFPGFLERMNVQEQRFDALGIRYRKTAT